LLSDHDAVWLAEHDQQRDDQQPVITDGRILDILRRVQARRAG
jgi:hypothetical protein